MSENADPQTRPVPTPAEMPWVITYLRDDIQDLRQDLRIQIKAVHDRIDETNRLLGEQIRAVHKRLWIMGTLVTITGILIAVIKL